jgi:hypothetical protein
MSKSNKYTIGWTNSPDVAEAAEAGNPGNALMHVVRYWISEEPWPTEQGTKEPKMVACPPLEILIPNNSATIEAPEGHRVFALVALVDTKNQIASPASPFEFIATPTRPPIRPTEVRVTKVSPVLKVLTPAPTPAVPPKAEDSISVFGHKYLVDGSLGRIVDIDEKTGTIHAEFSGSSFNEEGDAAHQDAETFRDSFSPTTPNPNCMEAQVVRADQMIVTLETYLQSKGIKLPEAATA